jgi:Cys-tRNA(Pro)/Cys-tRNA(Cys) deacylase
MIKNNVTRLLDAQGIPYTAFELPVEKIGALETAELVGVAAGLIFKTIVITREGKGKPILALVPGDKDVDLKALAQAVGEKKVHLPTQREAEKLTGLQAGGISPLALLNRGFQVIMDISAGDFTEIHISGGQRGLNLRLPTADLVSLTGAKLVSISKEVPSD